jgi:polyphosphate kinase 2 (PPK2 family)
MENLNNYIKLNEIAERVHANGERVAIILEGRDGAGKSGTVRELTRFLPPYAYRVQPSFMPPKKMMRNWFSEWQKLLPNHGEIVIYDRSWYSRALLQPVMGWCSHKQYLNFIDGVNAWEDSQLDLQIVKLWLSIDEIKQRELLQRRENDPLRYWKHSPNDAKAVENFDALTLKKNIMFSLDDWLIVNMDDKHHGRDTILDNIVKTL